MRVAYFNLGKSLTPPTGSILPADSLLNRISPRYLKEHRRNPHVLRDNNYAIQTLEIPLKAALTKRFGAKASLLVQRHLSVIGELFEHRFDIGVSRDDNIFVGSYGISFEINDREQAFQHARNAAVAIDDIRRQNTDLPVGVVVLPPIEAADDTSKSYSRKLDAYDRARHDLDKVGAKLLSEQQVVSWADTVVAKSVPRSLNLGDDEA